jgi:hypothetical protein
MADPLGGVVLRVIADEASYGDVRLLLRSILDDEELRQRCSSISMLIQSDVPLSSRQRYCRALIVTLLGEFEPREKAPKNKEGFKNTTAVFSANCAPVPYSRWAEHVEAHYKSRGVAEWIRVSPYLYDLIAAMEALWGVQGHLLRR